MKKSGLKRIYNTLDKEGTVIYWEPCKWLGQVNIKIYPSHHHHKKEMLCEFIQDDQSIQTKWKTSYYSKTWASNRKMCGS